MALQDSSSSFVITAKLFQFTNVKLENGLGENVDLEKSNLGNASGLVAGTFKLRFMPRSKFAFAALTSDIVLFLKSNETWGGVA